MSYTYKHLTSLDTGLMKDVLNMFGEAFGDKGSYEEKQPSDEYLKNLLTKEHFIALAAMDGEKVVGGIVAYTLEKFEQERKEIYIYDLAVAEAHRRKGIATALIEELKRVARERGAYVIFVQADEGDEAALALYERFGRKERTYNFDIGVQ